MSSITDICTAIHNVNSLKREIGFLIDENIGKERHDVYVVNGKVRYGVAATSLEDLFRASQQYTPGFSLSRRNRLYIAVTLASSVMQLDWTEHPGLRNTGKVVILSFYRQRTRGWLNQDWTTRILTCRWKVLPKDESTKILPDVDQAPAVRHIRNDFLFALGVTLIELAFKNNIAEMRIPEDGPPTEAMTHYNMAIRLAADVYNESGNRYGDVVQRCLLCPFNLRDLWNFGLDNEELQEAIFDHILTPLRQGFKDFQRHPKSHVMVAKEPQSRISMLFKPLTRILQHVQYCPTADSTRIVAHGVAKSHHFLCKIETPRRDLAKPDVVQCGLTVT